MKCPICKSLNLYKEYTLYDDRYGYPGTFDIFSCKICNHRSIQTFLSNEEITELYSKYYPRSNFNVKNFKPLNEATGFQSWIDGTRRSFAFVPKNVKVLDIGCGLGQSLAYHELRGCDAYGVEADNNIQHIADAYNLKIKIGTFNSNDYDRGFFDYITLDQVIEHFINPMRALHDMATILKPNGYIVMTTPNVCGIPKRIFKKQWINWHVPYHVHHFSKKSLRLMAKENGFTVITMKTITSSSWLYYQWIHSIDFAKQNEVSKFWGNKINTYTEVENQKYAFFTKLNKYKINHIITRIFDFIGLGDNILVILKKNE